MANLKTSYEAVSYTWGDALRTCKICCGGNDVRVTANLKQLLRYVRRPTERRRLWIDTIYIDQSNTNKRNHQVNIIGSIYNKATNVLIWVGDSNRDTKKVVSWFRDWAGASAIPQTLSMSELELVTKFYKKALVP